MSVITCCDLCGRVCVDAKVIETTEKILDTDFKMHYCLCKSCYEYLKKPKRIERPIGLIDRIIGLFRKRREGQIPYLCDNGSCFDACPRVCKHNDDNNKEE